MSDEERKYFAMHPSGGASHGDAHGSSHENGEEAEIPLTPIDRPLDLAAVRARLLPSDSSGSYRLTSVSLPAGRYRLLLITLHPQPRIVKLVRDPGWTELKPGRFSLRGLDVYPENPR